MASYGYARVSTKGQARDGNSLEVQRDRLLAEGCSEVFFDAFTGTTTDRPEFDRLMSLLRPGDVLVATKLDRLARSTVEGCELVKSLLDKGVTVRVLNMGTVEDTPVGRCIVAVMFAMAEMERDLIVERTQEGKAFAKAADPSWREGRRPIDLDEARFRELSAMADAGEVTSAQAAAELGISRDTWFRRRKALRAGKM